MHKQDRMNFSYYRLSGLLALLLLNVLLVSGQKKASDSSAYYNMKHQKRQVLSMFIISRLVPHMNGKHGEGH
jgi:hypothetical protein